ncbi:hypothetical protein CGZ92_09260 [Parenemella sanctibonifatiensis]|uniref:Pentapeptide repeat-containing protein n=2 Tax=Parenemella sanctibonifatiensis TaxID=2016505 RepID=A0A255E4P4_9ACTN|nr:hypothetical protein CGZ92_09260 [Parenemella sanctibonifatiensis]
MVSVGPVLLTGACESQLSAPPTSGGDGMKVRTPHDPIIDEQLRPAEVDELGPDAFLEGRLVTGGILSEDPDLAELQGCRIAAASMAGTHWRRADIRHTSFEGTDLNNLTAEHASWSWVTVSDARMTGVSMRESGLTDVAVSRAKMATASLRFCRLNRVAFTDCDLTGLDLTGSTLTDVSFTDCVLDQAQFHEVRCTRVRLAGCSLLEVGSLASLKGAHIRADDVDLIARELARALGLVLEGR